MKLLRILLPLAMLCAIAAPAAAQQAYFPGGVAKMHCATKTTVPGDTACPDGSSGNPQHVIVDSGGGSTGVAQGSTTAGQTLTPTGCRTLASAPTDTTAQTNMPSCTLAGAQRVDGSGVTQPVSIATMPSTPVTGTFYQVTQPVSAASLPLPSGAATSANQPSAAAIGSTTSGQTGLLVQGATTTSPPTYTTGQTNPLSLDTAGNLRVNVITGAATGVAQGSTTSGQTGGLGQAAVTTANPAYTTGQTSPLSLTPFGGQRIVPLDINGIGYDSTIAAPVLPGGFFPASTANVAAVQITCSSGNVANTAAVCTLAGTSGKTTYLNSWSCSASGATIGLVVNLTITGLIGGTQTEPYAAPAGALIMGAKVTNSPGPFPIAASAQNTAIVITLPALGAGNTNAACNASGFQF